MHRILKAMTIGLLFGLFVSTNLSAQVKPQANNAPIELTAQTFKQKVWNFDKDKKLKLKSKLPVILDFYATWCRPCKMLAPHLEDLQAKYKGKFILYKIDVDKEPELARFFNIEAMPTIIFMTKKGYNSELGYMEYTELENKAKSYLLF